jgi:ApbE superfamily uncharacterized protein (UPF0280 family)
LADAVATAIGNVVRDAADIPRAIEKAQTIRRLHGIIIIKDDEIGVWGEVKIVPLS